MPSPAIPYGIVQGSNTVIHGNASILVPQPNIRLSFNQYGIAICKTDYIIDKTLALLYAPGPFASHPWFSALQNSIGEMEIEFDPVFATLHCVYRGFFFGGDTNEPIYELTDTATAQPIDTHPQFVATLGGTAASPKAGAVFDSSGRFLGFTPNAHNNLGGIRSWLAPSLIWRATYVYDSWFDLESIGKVAVPDGPVPSIPTPQNWLFWSATQRQQGNAYQVTKEWRASDPGIAWNPLLYNYSM